MFSFLLAIGASLAVSYFGFVLSRKFVRNRLRYVDAIHNPIVPIVAGVGAAIVAVPIAGLLPIVTTGTAIIFGVGVGMGVAAGRNEIRRSLPPET